ncbi:MAG: phage protein Gp27 family protein, partial [Bacteroidota bacterium]
MSARRVQRKHFKVQELPEELRAAIDEQITRGVHYRDIAEYISQMGHEIGKSSVARYGKDFLTRLERIRVVRDQARAIVEADPDAP